MKKKEFAAMAAVGAVVGALAYGKGVAHGVRMTYFAMENCLAAEIKNTYISGGMDIRTDYARKMAREQMANLRADFKKNRRLMWKV